MAQDEERPETPEPHRQPESGTSIRIAMAVFIGTLFVLGAMGVYWMMIRV